MDITRNALPRFAGAGKATGLAAFLLILFVLGACGRDASTTSNPPQPIAGCDPADASTIDECGSVLVAFTDADGDFLNYTVDILSLKLETANGRIVEALPGETRVNFSDYVDLRELVTVATVPPATYVAGTIRFDYSDSEIFVAVGDGSKAAIVTDSEGTQISETELRIVLSAHDQLIVRRGLPALIQLDFDLDASHEVDTVPTPATATLEQFVVAETAPIDSKNTRVRGPLVEVNEDASSYSVALRPFHHRDGHFGALAVSTTADTEFEINGEVFFGDKGLEALAVAGRGTLTLADGTLHVADRELEAKMVRAGSSVPGFDRDAVAGNVIARDGNLLTIRGATYIPRDRRARFHDNILVEIGPNTRIFRDKDGETDFGVDAISIGQRVTIRGTRPDTAPEITDAAAPQILFDATEGAVRMHITHLSGIVNSVLPGRTHITLYAIDRHRAEIFDFAGTGASPALDADRNNYEIATGTLALADFSAGKPIVARGFPEAFGTAPPDFTGRTVIDYTDVESALGMGWGAEGTKTPFLRMDAEGLLLNNRNDDIGVRHHIRHGPVLIDLVTLPSDTLIVPRESDRMLFIIGTADSLQEYSDFGDFVADLSTNLGGASTARSMFARGIYDDETNIFTAYKVGIYLLQR
jgi:hypothetical protein